MRFKVIFFILSVLVILPGLFYLVTSGLKLGIDFTGGSLLEYQFSNEVSKEQLSKFGVVTGTGDRTYIIRTKPQELEQLNALKKEITDSVGQFTVKREESVGPVIGGELTRKALIGLVTASVMIVLYIAFSFRKVPKPTSSWRFGITAIIALIHDILFVVGVFAILGKFLNVEVDALFVTALLTIIGFSVHDTIVVFDRIRENLPKHLSKKFTEVTNISITQTIGRSLNTSLTVLLVLVALYLFGGESIKWFVVALIIGITAGTYSSIFIATGLLDLWEERLGH